MGFTTSSCAAAIRGTSSRKYFANYFLHTSDVTFDMQRNSMEVHHKHAEPWRVTLIDTGEETMTGGRLRHVRSFVGDSDFCMTYGDGVSDVDIGALVRFHAASGKLATITAVQPPGRFGTLDLQGDGVRSFREKPDGDGRMDQRRFFVLSRVYWTTSRAMTPSGSVIPWNGWLRKGNS